MAADPVRARGPLDAGRARAMGERWPNLGVFVHGGVSFAPYHDVFEQAMGRPLERVEVYPASEGFVGLKRNARAGSP